MLLRERKRGLLLFWSVSLAADRFFLLEACIWLLSDSDLKYMLPITTFFSVQDIPNAMHSIIGNC